MSVIRGICIAYCLTLFAATHAPVPELLHEIVSVYDKMIHAAAFCVLGALIFLTLCGVPPSRPPSLWMLLGLLIYAGIDEYLQGFTHRTPDLADWISDGCGIVLAFLLVRCFVLIRLKY